VTVLSISLGTNQATMRRNLRATSLTRATEFRRLFVNLATVKQINAGGEVPHASRGELRILRPARKRCSVSRDLTLSSIAGVSVLSYISTRNSSRVSKEQPRSLDLSDGSLQRSRYAATRGCRVWTQVL
jgi:hypothetical protein